MIADMSRKEAQFMDWYLPSAKQRSVSDSMTMEYAGAVDPEHLVITFIGPAADALWDLGLTDFDYDLYDSDGEFVRSQGAIPRNPVNQRVVLNRSVLIKLLSAMTSDWVSFDVATDYPVRVCGEIGDRTAGAIIAPRLE